MEQNLKPGFSASSTLDVNKAVPVRENVGRRTTSREFKNQMASMATSGQFTVEERLKAFRNSSLKSDQS